MGDGRLPVPTILAPGDPLLAASPAMTHEEVNAAVGAFDDATITRAVMAFLRSCR
jgi:hypothetical protein